MQGARRGGLVDCWGGLEFESDWCFGGLFWLVGGRLNLGYWEITAADLKWGEAAIDFVSFLHPCQVSFEIDMSTLRIFICLSFPKPRSKPLRVRYPSGQECRLPFEVVNVRTRWHCRGYSNWVISQLTNLKTPNTVYHLTYTTSSA